MGQIKEFRIMGLSINDSVYSCLFFLLLLGLFLLSLFFWGCSFSCKNSYFVNLRISEVHLFYNLQLFYWHFLEILWLFIFLVLYLYSQESYEIRFCIINEISFTIISMSSSDKFFLESGFFIRSCYYITNYHRNLLGFTLYIRS